MLKHVVCMMLLMACAARLSGQSLTDGPGKDAVLKYCTNCHETDIIAATHHTATEWRSVVDAMIGFGASIPGNDVEVIVAYLAKNYGKTGALQLRVVDIGRRSARAATESNR